MYEGTSTGYIQFMADVVSMVGVDDPQADEPALTLSPNPAHELLTIRFAGMNSQQKEVRIYDMGGRQVLYKRHDAATSEIKIDISSLVEGMYVVSIFRDGEVISDKLIVR